MQKRIIQYWHQESCPEYILERQRSWKVLSCWEYICFDANSASLFLKENFGDEVDFLFKTCAVPAMACDFFRCHVLACKEGLYVDSSFICLSETSLEFLFKDLKNPFFASVPSVDLTPEIVAARAALGKVLLNGIMYCPLEQKHYFSLLSKLVQEMVKKKVDTELAYVTGVAIVSMFDYLVTSSPQKSRLEIEKTIQSALSLGKENVGHAIMEFYDKYLEQFNLLASCKNVDFVKLSDIFYRPQIDEARFLLPEHWTNHTGSIFN